MKKTAILLWLVSAMVFMGAAQDNKTVEKSRLNQGQEQAVKDLDPKYQNWLNMVTYITFKEERRVFLRLANDRDRDAFINIFWLQRDPSPGTPENEFKSEIEQRFAYVNEMFRRGTSRPGWMTDMGKTYMVLGKPNTIERFDEVQGLYPAQVWYYYGDVSLGLPAYFNITFYKRFGVGEWKTYNPASDGPGSLLIQGSLQLDPSDYVSIYNRIYQVAPTLASPAMSMIPNEIPSNFQPSMRNNFILANIYESPIKKLNVSYATNFLKYKGFVDIESSINYIDNFNQVAVTRDERYDYSFVNLSIRPKKISLGFSEEKDKYFFNLNLNVSLRKGDNIIFQYAKNFEFYFEPDKVGGLEGGGVVVHDSFPVIPGDYQLVAFIENTVGKEFSYFDQAITVPAAGNLPFLATPIMGYKEEMESNNFFHPYKFFNKKLSVDTEKTFSLSDTPLVLIGAYNLTQEMWEKGAVEIELKGLNERNKFNRKVVLPLKEQPFAKNVNVIYAIDKNGLYTDYYELSLRLRNPSGIMVDSKNTSFTVSPMQKLSHPIETYKQMLVDNPYFFYYALGQQYEGIGALDNAELYYEKSVSAKADFAEGWLALLHGQNKSKKYAQALTGVENLKKFEKFAFDYYVIKGTALYGLDKFDLALEELLKANKIYNSDIRVLNLIGFTFFKLNEMDQALKAFDASLLLNSKQPQVEKAISEIKSKIQQNSQAQKDGKK